MMAQSPGLPPRRAIKTRGDFMQMQRLAYWFLSCALALILFLIAGWAMAQAGGPPYQINAAAPAVDEPDPAKSFWRDQVHYPFPVKYAKAADSRGVEWEIAY